MGNHLLYGCTVTNSRSANQRILNVFFKGVGLVHHRGDTSLGIICIAFIHLTFGDDDHFAHLGSFQGIVQTRDATTDDSSALPAKTLRSTSPEMPGMRWESVCCHSCHFNGGQER